MSNTAETEVQTDAFPVGGGELGALIGAFDWSTTPLGPIERWPRSLKTATGLLLLSPLPIVMLWGEDGIMLYNDAYSVFAGGRHPTLLGSKVREGWPEVADFNDNVMKVGLAGGTLSFKNQELTLHRTGAPEQVWMNLDYSPVPGDDGRPAGVIAFVVETTAEVLAQERLRGADERLQLALSAGGGIGTWDWDIRADRVVADERFARLYGVPVEIAASGAPIADFFRAVHPDDIARLEAQVQAALVPDTEFYCEYRLVQAVDSIRWVAAQGRVVFDADGQPLRFPGASFDITTRADAEAALRKSEARLRELNASLEQQVAQRMRELHDSMEFARMALTAVGGVGVWTYDLKANRYVCDENIAKLYDIDPARGMAGFTREEFLANVHPDDIEALTATLAAGLANLCDLELEYRLRHRDGSVRWVMSRGHTYFEGDRAVRRTGIGVDMTRQRLLEEELRQSQKMEAVGQLTGGIAHDFNNLLAGISGSLEVLERRIAQGRLAGVERYITAAQGASRRAAALTQRLLAFSRRQTLDPKPTDVNRLIGGMEDLIRGSVGPAVQVEVVGAAGLWLTRVDPSQLENALLNLCINARDAMAPDGGRLTIETANKWLDDRHARERDMTPGQYISLCVTDTGTGMTPEVIARAFDPFFTTKPMGEGTGLGLSMIYGFVRQSGGQVRIYSEVGQGTTMCLYLPRHLGENAADADRDKAVPAPAAEGDGLTVLVIDDEPTVRMVVVEVLNEHGYTALEAADGAAGLKILRSEARVDLLITDVGLPGGLNGRQIADAARTTRPDLKVLFITGYAENAAVGNGLLEPGMAVMTKPFLTADLGAKIYEMIDG